MIKEIKIKKNREYTFKNSIIKGKNSIIKEYQRKIVDCIMFSLDDKTEIIIIYSLDKNKIYNIYFRKNRLRFVFRTEGLFPISSITTEELNTIDLFQVIFEPQLIDNLFKLLYIFLSDKKNVVVDQATISYVKTIGGKYKIKILTDLEEIINNLFLEFNDVKGEN